MMSANSLVLENSFPSPDETRRHRTCCYHASYSVEAIKKMIKISESISVHVLLLAKWMLV